MHLRKNYWYNIYNEVKSKPFLKKNINFLALEFTIDYFSRRLKINKWLKNKFLDRIFFNRKRYDYSIINFFIVDLSRKKLDTYNSTNKQLLKYRLFNLGQPCKISIKTRLKSIKNEEFKRQINKLYLLPIRI